MMSDSRVGLGVKTKKSQIIKNANKFWKYNFFQTKFQCKNKVHKSCYLQGQKKLLAHKMIVQKNVLTGGP